MNEQTEKAAEKTAAEKHAAAQATAEKAAVEVDKSEWSDEAKALEAQYAGREDLVRIKLAHHMDPSNDYTRRAHKPGDVIELPQILAGRFLSSGYGAVDLDDRAAVHTASTGR